MDLLLDQGVAICMGLSLAATCGLRAFLPLLVIGLLGMLGKVELAEAFTWMASPVAVTCFGTAVIAEVVGDKFPAVDHALDAAGLVVKPTAATLAAASMITAFDPLLALVLGVVTGGVAAEAVHVAKAKARVLSSALSAGMGNPVLSTIEDGVALAAVGLAWLAPVGAAMALLLSVTAMTFWLVRRRRRRALALAHR